MLKDSKIFVAGHKGLVGSAILKKLQADYEKLNYKAKDVIDKVQKESPAVYKLLIQKGLLPKD